MPIKIGDYTDFYASFEHAYNCGVLIRGPDNAIQPNWKHLPVGYHGRASSVVVSGTPFHRPTGQILDKPGDKQPIFAPCRRLDYELEIGCIFGGAPTKLGQRISPAEARKQIFGFVLLNDWSARDVQTWEYVPLGPFTSKNFCTTIAPWVVSPEALKPFEVKQYDHDPALLPYLRPAAEAELRARVLAAAWTDVVLLPAPVGDHAALTGGAREVLRGVVEDPSAWVADD